MLIRPPVPRSHVRFALSPTPRGRVPGLSRSRHTPLYLPFGGEPVLDTVEGPPLGAPEEPLPKELGRDVWLPRSEFERTRRVTKTGRQYPRGPPRVLRAPVDPSTPGVRGPRFEVGTPVCYGRRCRGRAVRTLNKSRDSAGGSPYDSEDMGSSEGEDLIQSENVVPTPSLTGLECPTRTSRGRPP